MLLRGPPFSQFSTGGASENSTFGSQTLLAMRKFLDEAELHSRQRACNSPETEKVANEEGAECNGEDSIENEVDKRLVAASEMSKECSQSIAEKEVFRAFRALLNGFEEQWHWATQPESVSSESEVDEIQNNTAAHAVMAQSLRDEVDDESVPRREPQLYLCDDWIQPMAVARKPRSMTAKEMQRANVAKNCLILTMMSLDLGYGSINERYRQAQDAVVERYHQRPNTSARLDPVILADEEVSVKGLDQCDESTSSVAAPATRKLVGQVHALAPKDSNLKLYHVMSVKQTLREDLQNVHISSPVELLIGQDLTCMLYLCSLNP